MNDIDAVSPLKDVWLRPRRVFRELAANPIGLGDLVLAALQGITDYVTVSRWQHLPVPRPAPREVLIGALLFGSLAGMVGTYFLAFIYSRIGTRLGGKAGFASVFHVLAYGAVPRVAALLIWGGIALVVGDAAFLDIPPAGTDNFVVILLRAENYAAYLLIFWSYLLIVMGLSEIYDFKPPKAFGLFVLGQLIAAVVALLAVNLLAAPK